MWEDTVSSVAKFKGVINSIFTSRVTHQKQWTTSRKISPAISFYFVKWRDVILYFSRSFTAVVQNASRYSRGGGGGWKKKRKEMKMLTGWVTIIWSVVAMATDPSSQPLESESHEWIEGDRKHTVHTCCQLDAVYLWVREGGEGSVCFVWVLWWKQRLSWG